MRELIAEHKPHIDKMNKTGPQLLELSPVEGIPIREKYTATDLLYAQLKADVKQRAATLDEAISKSTQVRYFHLFYLVCIYPLFIQVKISMDAQVCEFDIGLKMAYVGDKRMFLKVFAMGLFDDLPK